MGILKWTQTGKDTHTGALCQENNEFVKLEQRPVTMGGRTAHRTMLPKKACFQTGIKNSPICDRCLEKEGSAILCDCEAIAYLRFRHLGHYFMEPGDYHDVPIRKVLRFIRSVGLTKEYARRGITIDLGDRRAKAE
jgi:hypothetical protein